MSAAAARDMHVHTFLRPDHWEVADLWAPHWGSDLPPLAFRDRHDWLFEHLETLHEAGARTLCAIDGRTGDVAGFVTFDPAAGRLHQMVVATTARGSGAASLLLDEVKRLSPRGLTADVPAAAARALRFFTREGFVETGRAVGIVRMSCA